MARPAAPAEPAPPEAGAQNPLYAFDEAIADALSGPLTFIGVGGDGGHLSCAYRNERVIVIDDYCTRKEMSAFGVAVFSPARGRVKLYAEARAPISTLKKADYLTFYGESEPASATLTPALSLSMPYEAIAAYDRARARRYLPSCVNGMEGGRHKEACHKSLQPQAAAFAARSQPFLQEPPEAWYQLVRRLADERKQERVIVTPGSFRAVGEAHAWSRRIALSRYYVPQIGNTEGWFAPILMTDDGGVLIAGTLGSSSDGHYTPGATVPVAVRLDATGKVLWERPLKRKGFIEFEGQSAVATPDGFVVLVSSFITANSGAVPRLIKLERSGKPQWEWVGRGSGGQDTPFPDSVQRTPTGSFLMRGHISPKGDVLRSWTGEVDAAGKLLRDEVGDPMPDGRKR